MEVVARTAGGEVEPLDDGLEDRARGAGDRRRPDLLVVEEGDHREVVVRLGRGQRGRRRPARHLVVEAAAGQQRAVGAEDGGRLDVEEPELPRRRHGGAGALGDPRREVGAEVGGPHRAHVRLAIEDEAPLVDVAIEVDGELRHPGDRLVDRHERRRAVRRDEATGDAEVAVQPAVEQHPAVDLDAELAPPGAVDVGAGLDAQVRRIGVGADEAHRQGTGTGRAAPGHDGPAAHDEPGVRDVVPRRRLIDRAEPGGDEQVDRRTDGVPRRWRGVEEGAQRGGRVVRGAGHDGHDGPATSAATSD